MAIKVTVIIEDDNRDSKLPKVVMEDNPFGDNNFIYYRNVNESLQTIASRYEAINLALNEEEK